MTLSMLSVVKQNEAEWYWQKYSSALTTTKHEDEY